MVIEAQQAATSGGLAALGVNGKLLLAQALNFGIVVLVMWRWVYRPLVAFMEERTTKIERGLKDAEAAAAAKTGAEAERLTVVAEARAEAKRIIEAAEVAAAQRGNEMLSKTRDDMARTLAEGRSQLNADRQAMMKEARAELAEIALVVAKKALGEIMNEKKDAAVVKSAVESLKRKV